MDEIFSWIMKNKAKMIVLGFILFIIPLITVHILFSFEASSPLLVSKWSAGEMIGYIASFEAFLGTVFLGALALWQNRQMHKQHIESLEPQLSMKLFSTRGVLYLAIENTGAVAAKNIRLVVDAIKNNGENEDLYLDELFDSIFELYPHEVVQGRIAISGENIATAIFPQITISVSYIRSDIERINRYSRSVIFDNGYASKISADINLDNRKLEADTDFIARSIVRVANYLDGNQVLKMDELNILAGKSLRNDIVEALESKEKVEVLSRIKTIESCIKELQRS